MDLSRIATYQPHAAYSAFTHGVSQKWTYLSRVIPGINDQLQPVEDAIRQHLLPALTGRSSFNDNERALLSLPPRLGGLGIGNAVANVVSVFEASTKVSGPLCALEALQTAAVGSFSSRQRQAKAEVHRDQRSQAMLQQTALLACLPPTTQRVVELASEQGASTWLISLPLASLGFHLNKAEFRDGLCLRYDWRLPYLPSHCVCGQLMNVEHALSCSVGGLPSQRHNHLRDLTATLLTEVASNVGVEPPLMP